MSAFPFDLPIPVLQAPVGGASTPRLCVAVSNAGGMGGIALSWTEPTAARDKIRAVHRGTDRPFYVNFALAFHPISLAAALEEGVPCVTFSWGDPRLHVSSVRASGAKLGIQVTNMDGAKYALDLGADFLICQGVEAGGHVQSTIGLEELLPEILEVAGNAPVVASGGISTGAHISKWLQMGAAAVSIGTRFVATVESGAHEHYKSRLASDGPKETALTVCFDGGWPAAPHRVLRNRTLETWEASGCPATGVRPGEGETVAYTESGEPILRYDSAQPLEGAEGVLDDMCLYAGTGVSEIREAPAAADLLASLWEEARSEMDTASGPHR